MQMDYLLIFIFVYNKLFNNSYWLGYKMRATIHMVNNQQPDLFRNMRYLFRNCGKLINYI